MANTRDIKRRISSVTNIGHITKAMEMVAGAKLRRAQANVIAARPYTLHLAQLISRLQKSGLEVSNPLLETREGPPAYIVIAGDRGLSGAYNANTLRFAQEDLQILSCIRQGFYEQAWAGYHWRIQLKI